MNYEILVNEEKSHIIWNKKWLNPKIAVDYYNELLEKLPWVQTYEKYTFKLKNNDSENNEVFETKVIPVPRLIYYCGDKNNDHSYGSQNLKLDNWEKTILLPLALTANEQLGVNFNSCLVNYYRNGKDSINFHADKECNPPNYIVLTIALFSDENYSRDFQIRRKYIKGKEPPSPIITVPMKCGDTIVMFGKRVQKDWWHCVPKRKNGHTRISITYRELNKQT